MDRVGISWRRELAAGIFASLKSIDVIEVIADDYFGAPISEVRALRTLATQAPVWLHGIGMGLASTVPVERRRVENMARLFEQVRPEGWSEHLAFVRGGGIEIGHLAAPPRNQATVDGALANLDRTSRIIGTNPLVENIATLISPPGSPLSESAWIRAILRHSGAGLLLDLNNVYTNARNTGYDPLAFLDELPLHHVRVVHIAGGRTIRHNRLLDDHKHPVPDPVYELLAALARRVPRPLTVILERDGNYPAMDALVAELDRAREAIRRGRAAA
jgi:uncharacterized protein (UPF0276 family)